LTTFTGTPAFKLVDRGVGVPEIVQPDPGQRGLGEVAFEDLAEQVRVVGLPSAFANTSPSSRERPGRATRAGAKNPPVWCLVSSAARQGRWVGARARRKRNDDDQGAVFIDVVSFGPRAEAVAEHMTKGRQVAVSGRLEYQEWKAQDGSPRSRHEVIGEQVQFLGARPSESAKADDEPDYGSDEEVF